MNDVMGGLRTARRRKAQQRARRKAMIAAVILAISTYMVGAVDLAGAAPPGAFAITDGYPLCYPVASVTIKVSTLASGSAKRNVVTATWTDGSYSTDFPPVTIDPSQYAASQPSDVVVVNWTGQEGPDLGPFTATLNATLTWVWDNGNTKQVATATESQVCT
ncbi:MAG: hypothetical protein ACXVQX_10980 [Actinomycetota bacterium]